MYESVSKVLGNRLYFFEFVVRTLRFIKGSVLSMYRRKDRVSSRFS